TQRRNLNERISPALLDFPEPVLSIAIRIGHEGRKNKPLALLTVVVHGSQQPRLCDDGARYEMCVLPGARDGDHPEKDPRKHPDANRISPINLDMMIKSTTLFFVVFF